MECLEIAALTRRNDMPEMLPHLAADPLAPPLPDWARAAWSTGLAAVALFGIAIAITLIGGCAGRPTLWPNSDPALRKTSAEFAADGAKRHPFKTDAPRAGDAQARVTVDYGLDLIQIANLSDEDWTNVEVWVNKNYVVFIPKLEKNAAKAETINFSMLYDDQGHTFPTNNVPKENQIHSVEVLRDGKMYDVKVALSD